jgi:hypothetical protein
MYERVLGDDLEYPEELVGDEARSLISGLLTRNPEARLGSASQGGAHAIMHHPFFGNHVNWDDLYQRRIPPPYVPRLKGEEDLSHFDEEFTRMTPRLSPIMCGHAAGSRSENPSFKIMRNSPTGNCYSSSMGAGGLGMCGSVKCSCAVLSQSVQEQFAGYSFVSGNGSYLVNSAGHHFLPGGSAASPSHSYKMGSGIMSPPSWSYKAEMRNYLKRRRGSSQLSTDIFGGFSGPGPAARGAILLQKQGALLNPTHINTASFAIPLHQSSHHMERRQHSPDMDHPNYPTHAPFEACKSSSSPSSSTHASNRQRQQEDYRSGGRGHGGGSGAHEMDDMLEFEMEMEMDDVMFDNDRQDDVDYGNESYAPQRSPSRHLTVAASRGGHISLSPARSPRPSPHHPGSIHGTHKRNERTLGGGPGHSIPVYNHGHAAPVATIGDQGLGSRIAWLQ